MKIAHLTASPFFGGPERQMCGFARSLPPGYQSVFLCFTEGGLSQPFIGELQRDGFATVELKHNAPDYVKSVREISGILSDRSVDILLCHGYKPDLLGLIAAKFARIPVISVSRGWTGETLKVRINETLDKLSLYFMDCVVCVSEGQAIKVRKLGIADSRIKVIRNAINMERFVDIDPASGESLQGMFKRPRSRIVGAAGRLSPEKGFADLITAAASVIAEDNDIGFVIFGEGRLRDELSQQIAALGLTEHVLLPGFSNTLDKLLPAFDLLVQSSYTEGLPNILLEGSASGVPIVATNVGGTSEVVQDGVSGYLVPPGDPNALAGAIKLALFSADGGRSMGEFGRQYVGEHFSFKNQSAMYQQLFHSLTGEKC